MSIYAYIDESGNTGDNVFDEAQPVFRTAAVIASFDFDSRYRSKFDALATAAGVAYLHSAELGLSKLAPLLPDIQRIIKKDTVRFFLARVVKRHLVVAKLFDLIFDPGENAAAPWHAYWGKEMRFLLLIKLSYICTDEILKAFWMAMMERNTSKSDTLFSKAIGILRTNVPKIPDARSREIFDEAFQWALSYPDELTFRSRGKRDYVMHLPNMIAFPSMLEEINRQAEFFRTEVFSVNHDRQSEVEKTLEKWHALHANAAEGSVWIYGQERSFRFAQGSKFNVLASPSSPGIQLADIILWLSKKESEGVSLPPEAMAFLKVVRKNSISYEVSDEFVEEEAARTMKFLFSLPMSGEQEAAGRDLLQEFESRRQAALVSRPLLPL